MLSKNTILLPMFLLSIPSGTARSSVTSSEAFSAAFHLSKNTPHFSTNANTQRSQNLPPSSHFLDPLSKTNSLLSTTALTESSRGGDISKPSFSQKLLAETIGTFLIVNLGCGTVCAAIYQNAQQGLWQIAAVWSLAVTLAIYTTAGISGAHLNPAISIAMKICRPNDHQDMNWKQVFQYCLAQTTGAIMAAGVNLALYWESIRTFEASQNIVRGAASSIASASAFGEYWSVSSWKQAFLAEGIGTFLLSFLIFSLTNSRNEAVPSQLVPALIGATVGCLISVIAPLTQAGFNPARDFGPRIVAWCAGWGKAVAMKGWWVYVLAPIVGAVLGGFMAENVLWKKED